MPEEAEGVAEGASSQASPTTHPQKNLEIFGDQRPVWQKCKDIFNLKQSADQPMMDFAGILRQQQHRMGVENNVLLAVFIDGLLNNLAKQVAILNPDSRRED